MSARDDLMAIADATSGLDYHQPIPYALTDLGKHSAAAAQSLAPVLHLVLPDEQPTLVLDELRETWGPRPAPVPFDPADLDRIPPDDLLICERCCGQGVLEAIQDGYVVDRRCGFCAGTGERRRP